MHVSTDESTGRSTSLFTEETPIQSRSPYSSSKAKRPAGPRSLHTHGMDCVVTRCSNNHGPFQFPELIPLMIANALEDQPLPIYEDGKNVRDWIHVADH